MKIKSIVFALLLAVLSMLSVAVRAMPTCWVGENGQVLWKGKWYAATVLKVNENQTRCYIHYAGYESRWDEWVGGDRFRGSHGPAMHHEEFGYQPGDAVNVRWKGRWYPASIMRAHDGKYKVHYDGYDNSWDEWVDLDRIRRR